VTCVGDQRCDENTGTCVDPCAGIVCADPKVCQRGSCVDCNTLGCGAGQLCVGGRCQVNQCASVTCGNGQYCDDGRCVDLCQPNKCTANQRCAAGQCLDDPCAQVACPTAGDFCDPTTGTCKIDLCQATQCEAGSKCLPGVGQCKADPCLMTTCPGPCFACEVTADGLAACKESGACPVIPVKVGIKGGASFSCTVGTAGDGTGIGLTLALAAASAFLRRRRR
jgi:MYXO-CTERM domain-containing protein